MIHMGVCWKEIQQTHHMHMLTNNELLNYIEDWHLPSLSLILHIDDDLAITALSG